MLLQEGCLARETVEAYLHTYFCEPNIVDSRNKLNCNSCFCVVNIIISHTNTSQSLVFLVDAWGKCLESPFIYVYHIYLCIR